MKFKLEFNMNDDCFNEYMELEIKRILVDIGGKVTGGHVDGNVRDGNGNRIGEWGIEVEGEGGK